MDNPTTWEELYNQSEDRVAHSRPGDGAVFEVLSIFGCFLRVHLRVQRDEPVTPHGLTFLAEEMQRWWRESRLPYLRARGEKPAAFIGRERAVDTIVDYMRETLLNVQAPL